MLNLRPSNERGHADHGWLRSAHSFSFATYQDPRFMGFGNLRVINEDRIKPGTGFGQHGHRDMEIVSVVLDGALAHQDSLGTGSVIGPGEIQRMSAGTGIRHGEFNPSHEHSTHFLQIWFLPDAPGGSPSYAQKAFAPQDKAGRLCLLVSPDGAQGSVAMGADARLWAGNFDGNQHAQYRPPAGRWTYVHLVRGRLQVQGQTLNAGDAVWTTDPQPLDLEDGQQAEVLVFDLRPEPDAA